MLRIFARPTFLRELAARLCSLAEKLSAQLDSSRMRDFQATLCFAILPNPQVSRLRSVAEASRAARNSCEDTERKFPAPRDETALNDRFYWGC